MHSETESHNSIFGITWNSVLALMIALLVLIGVALFLVFTAQPAQGQTYRVIYNFTGGEDGGNPEAGLTIDESGNLYGTIVAGGPAGAVFELERTNSGWRERTLYQFRDQPDGASPAGRVIFGPDGSLYGVTEEGGISVPLYCNGGCGTVFRLTRPATACTRGSCPWTETVLYRFAGSPDGALPVAEVAFDQAGNMYGTTSNGGSGNNGYGNGTVYELSPSGGGWTESVLWTFSGGSDGYMPFAGVILDQNGNLYGTSYGGGDHRCFAGGGYGCGVVFELTPAYGGWAENVLYSFRGGSDGGYPAGGLISDQSGNLFGTTEGLGLYGGWRLGPGTGGSAFKLSLSNDGWSFSALHSFTMLPQLCWLGPAAGLAMDSAGRLYGTTACNGAYGLGNVFELIPSDGGWTYSSLHDFLGGNDAQHSYGNVVFDANGNMYGTTLLGGSYDYGTVWEITP